MSTFHYTKQECVPAAYKVISDNVASTRDTWHQNNNSEYLQTWMKMKQTMKYSQNWNFID